MRRFIANSWWTLALALTLSIVGVVALPAPGRTEGGGSLIGEPPSGTDPSDNTGDPDIPINTGKSYAKPLSRYGRSVGLSQRGVGDVPAAQIVWAYKYRIALQLFRLYVLRF